jgi:hypothetical protein
MVQSWLVWFWELKTRVHNHDCQTLGITNVHFRPDIMLLLFHGFLSCGTAAAFARTKAVETELQTYSVKAYFRGKP